MVSKQMPMKENAQPLVTVIITAYNHENYIGEALRSLNEQTYRNIQLIIIDNASTDRTLAIIERYLETHPQTMLVRQRRNIGLCGALNHGLSLANGKYLVDLSADDVFLPERIERQVQEFERLADDYAVIFSNAKHIDQNGKFIRHHYEIDEAGKTVNPIPTGDVYKDVLEKYFICTPTMMIRTDVLREMNGFDETLKFEDFDFWVRSSVRYRYFYQDEVLTLKRNTPGSLGTQIYSQQSGMLESCYTVCNKAYDLNRNQEEFDLLAARIRTFIRKCWYAQEFELALKFRKLLNFIEDPGWKTELIVILCRMKVPVNGIYRLYLKYFHNYHVNREVLPIRIVSW
jgi:glycosyltransferase involved in cell wall biosynthesis